MTVHFFVHEEHAQESGVQISDIEIQVDPADERIERSLASYLIKARQEHTPLVVTQNTVPSTD